MKVKVIDKLNVYGCSYVERFRTTDYNEAQAMEMVHGNREAIEEWLLATGRYTRESKRFKGAVDNLIDYGVWQEKTRLDRNPVDHFGIDTPT